ncbi:hypothetical protein O7634_21995 [Micromonospora sp. WMMD1120]|uniref:hypothetical protein n=1 Tax=Micromonospora sp. WMMD1120 TaxID=3016106 RepID=UPI002417B164|nr:hypothetical protein [Micromonospora sp. WMMD1120]MDG4809428.1 hypothetical protein [Micromonospora sp. WMMD1120]
MTTLAALIVAAGVAVAPQTASAATVAPAASTTKEHRATTDVPPIPLAPTALDTGEYDYFCLGADGSGFWLSQGEPTTNCHGSYLLKYIDGNQVGSYNLAYGGGAAQTPPWNTGCVLALASGVALFIFPPSGATAWVVQGALAGAGLLVSCVV